MKKLITLLFTWMTIGICFAWTPEEPMKNLTKGFDEKIWETIVVESQSNTIVLTNREEKQSLIILLKNDKGGKFLVITYPWELDVRLSEDEFNLCANIMNRKILGKAYYLENERMQRLTHAVFALELPAEDGITEKNFRKSVELVMTNGKLFRKSLIEIKLKL